MEKCNEEFITHVAKHVSQFGFNSDVSIFIGCQFALESFYGRSNLVHEHQNYCGMKVPMVRISVANNAADPSQVWAHYSGLEWCITDFMLCLQYHRPYSDIKDNRNAYARFISRFYCPERDYISKIQGIYSDYIKSITKF